MVCWYLGLIFLSLLSSASTQYENYDYCDPKLNLCHEASDHTMCQYPTPGLSARCTPAVHEPLSATERKRILFWHNKFRSNVATGTERNKNRKLATSSNMRQLYWDKELEVIAERWAEQCVSTADVNIYDKCRNTRRFQVSQNVGTRMVNASTIDKQTPQIVITWYKEGKDFEPTLVDNFQGVEDKKKAVKQFANLIWADTYAIGCARIIFQEELPIENSKLTSTWTVERLVCNYGPGGNEVGKPIYKRGFSCEHCPGGTQCSTVYPGLCAMQNAEKLESPQSAENQEPKEEGGKQVESSSESTTVAELMKMEETEDFFPPFETTIGFLESTTSCSGDECLRNNEDDVSTEATSRDKSLFEGKKSTKPPARKRLKKDDVELFVREKLKWSLPKGRRTVRAANKTHPIVGKQNGDRCSCYVPLNNNNNSSCGPQYNFLLLLLPFLLCNFFFE